MTPSTQDLAALSAASPGLAAAPAAPAAKAPQEKKPGALWLREPLLHFVLLGALLFAADRALVERSDDPRLIVIGAEVDAEAREVFQASRNRLPEPQELAALRQVWLDNEVLYREGLALQVDRGDKAIRERVIFKALSVLNADLKAPAAEEKALREWFEARRSKYDEPARFDFQEAVLVGDNSEAAVRAFVDLLVKGTPGEQSAGLRVFKARPLDNLVQSYGADFAAALQAGPLGEWRALQTREGWRAVRLDGRSAAKPASFEDFRGVVMHDWIDSVMADKRSAAVRALQAKYKVRYEDAQQ